MVLMSNVVPVIVSLKTDVPATDNPVPLMSCSVVLFNLAPMLLEPAFCSANSIKPSSVVSDASEIFAVIFAYTTS